MSREIRWAFVHIMQNSEYSLLDTHPQEIINFYFVKREVFQVSEVALVGTVITNSHRVESTQTGDGHFLAYIQS